MRSSQASVVLAKAACCLWCYLLWPRSVIALRCALDQLKGDGGLDHLELGSCSSCVVVAVSHHSFTLLPLHLSLYSHVTHGYVCITIVYRV